MRISENTNANVRVINQTVSKNTSVERPTKQENKAPEKQAVAQTEQNQSQLIDNSEETKVKVQEAVKKMNDMLEVHNSKSKFLYHEGLDRYYVTVVDRETEKVVKEIPPKKLLDSFYEMQKMLGMIVDEKI